MISMRSVIAPALSFRAVMSPFQPPPRQQASMRNTSRGISRKLIAGEVVPPATYKDFGGLVALGGYDAYGTLGRFGFYKGGFIKGRIAQLGHAMLYRRYQASLHGIWRGTLLWFLDTVGRKVRPRAGFLKTARRTATFTVLVGKCQIGNNEVGITRLPEQKHRSEVPAHPPGGTWCHRPFHRAGRFSTKARGPS
jgi:hypothetical protein